MTHNVKSNSEKKKESDIRLAKQSQLSLSQSTTIVNRNSTFNFQSSNAHSLLYISLLYSLLQSSSFHFNSHSSPIPTPIPFPRESLFSTASSLSLSLSSFSTKSEFTHLESSNSANSFANGSNR